MKKKRELLILSSTIIAKDTYEMVLENQELSEITKPGQFLHISVPNYTLRRPISIADLDTKAGTITIVFKIVGSGTKQLSELGRGTTIDVLGPLGNGFDVSQSKDTTVLLIGGGVGVPPLHYLGRRLDEQGVTVKTILGFQTANSVFYEEEFNEFSQTHIATDDGSYGNSGFVTDVIDQVGNFDSYYTCGPSAMIKAVTQKLSDKPGYISLEERMGCGIGACFACVIKTDNQGGYKKICQDGPVFAAKEVTL